jgi:hypothetical protein
LGLQFKVIIVHNGVSSEHGPVQAPQTSALTVLSSEIPTIDGDQLISVLAFVRRNPEFVPRKEQPIEIAATLALLSLNKSDKIAFF